MRQVPVMIGLLFLAGCGSQSTEGAGGVSASEASALNDAAAMLDAQRSDVRPEAGLNPAATAAARADRQRVAPDNQNAPQ